MDPPEVKLSIDGLDLPRRAVEERKFEEDNPEPAKVGGQLEPATLGPLDFVRSFSGVVFFPFEEAFVELDVDVTGGIRLDNRREVPSVHLIGVLVCSAPGVRRHIGESVKSALAHNRSIFAKQ